MDYLSVDGHDVPATYAAWRALREAVDQAAYTAVRTAFTTGHSFNLNLNLFKQALSPGLLV